MPNKVIALDIGNVCLHIHPERCLALLKDCNCASIPPELLRYEADELERGRVSEADFLAKVREMTGTRASDKTLTDAFLAILGEPVEGMPELVKSKGVSIVLFTPPEVILERVSKNDKRPLLNTPNPLERIKTLLKERHPYYMKSGVAIATDPEISETVKHIVRIYKNRISEKRRRFKRRK